MLSKDMLEHKLTNLINNNPLLIKLIDLLKDFSKIYLVGGIIRDIALEKKALDIDLCTSLNINEVSKILEKSFKIIDTGIKHGTITAIFDHVHAEITEFRGEKNSLESDLSLRDFTINAIAFDIVEKKLIDPFNGLDDLKNNILRCTIDPNIVFNDDPLRMVRAFRFSYAENRKLDENIIKALKTNFDKIKTVSIERIKDELSKILVLENPSLVFKKLVEFNFLDTLFPEITPMVNCAQNKYHVHDVFNHTLDVLENTPPILETRLAALLHDIGKPHTISVDSDGERHFYGHEKESVKIAKKFLERLCFPNKTINTVLNVVNLHMRDLEAKGAGIRRLIRELGDDFNVWLILVKADRPPKMPKSEFEKRLNNFLKNYNFEIEEQKRKDFFKLKITGEDIMKILNLKPSKEVGEIKNMLQELIIEDPSKNDREFLINYIKETFIN